MCKFAYTFSYLGDSHVLEMLIVPHGRQGAGGGKDGFRVCSLGAVRRSHLKSNFSVVFVSVSLMASDVC